MTQSEKETTAVWNGVEGVAFKRGAVSVARKEEEGTVLESERRLAERKEENSIAMYNESENCRAMRGSETGGGSDDLRIPIFLASDDNYAPFAATMMFSVLENTQAAIDFYVLDGGISEVNKAFIRKALERFSHKTLTYFDMSTYGLERFPDVKHYSLNTFSRYFISSLQPDLGKVLYLDVDIIVKGDIAGLYAQDLEGKPVGAVLEDFYEGNYTRLKQDIYPAYDGGDCYFNAGVMLMDVQKLIAGGYEAKMVWLTTELFDKLNCPDQDVFNILFSHNFKVLDYKYNFMPDLAGKLRKKHPETQSLEPVVVHYTVGKPWKSDCAMKADFDRVLAETPFAGFVASKYADRKIERCYYLFGILPLLKIKQKSNGTWISIRFLGFIPLYRISCKSGSSRHYMFGILPWLKIREK